MEKKYYDLISSLIENHKKYSEYSAIREELIEHVLEQAQTVIDTVSDEKVVEGYLAKIITSAFIIVPKKLNFNVKQRQNFGDTFAVPTTRIERTKKHTEPETELYSLTQEVNEVHNTVEIQEEIDENNEAKVVNKALIDKMINGVSSNETSTNIEDLTETIDSNVTELYESLDNLEAIEKGSIEIKEDKTESEEAEENEDLENTVVLDLDAPDEFLDLDVDEIIIQEEDEHNEERSEPTEDIIEENISEEVENININDELEETFDEVPTLDTTSSNEENLLSTDQLAEEEPVLEIINETEEHLSLEGLTTESDLTDANEEQDGTINNFEILEINELKNSEVIVNTEVVTQEDSTELEYCYSHFIFESTAKEIDTDMVLSSLNNLDQKYPEKQVLEIVNLKFNKKLSITEIAEKTGLTNKDVIETLNEVIDIVKD